MRFCVLIVGACFVQATKHARMHNENPEMHNCTVFDFNRSSAVARTFGEAERRLVICIDFTVALALRRRCRRKRRYIGFIFLSILIVLRK